MEVYKLRDNVDVVSISYSELDYIDFALCEQPRETLGHYYNRMTRKPNVLVNGGFFSMSNGNTCFSFIDNGEEIFNHYGVKEGIGTLNKDRNKLVFGNIDDGQTWYDFIAGYPVLVKDGKAVEKFTWGSEINYKAARSCIGYNDDKIIIVTVSKPGGVKFDELAEIMVSCGCTTAINLDGGGSSRLMVDGAVVNKPTENRSVDSVIAVYLKDPSEGKEEVDDRPYISYTVVKGDTLWGISTEYLGTGTRYKEIMEANGLFTSSLKVGQVLKIYVDCEKYTVKYGDTLWNIAAAKMGSGTKYKYLMEFNNLTSTTIRVGQIIYIPV